MTSETYSSNSDELLAANARSLIKRLYARHHDYYGMSTTSCQIYDTAWVSMVPKTSEGKKEWLFPTSFYYLLKAQSDDGGWGTHPASTTAGILDTAASLLALLKHLKGPLQIHDVSTHELSRRIQIASISLRTQLASWDDISETNHIGVEIIVPSLLAYLAKEDMRLTFEFPCKGVLQAMNESKLSNFHPESLYKDTPSSAVHSLEAFLDIVDFDKLSHHVFHGSMLASPSSTAAYLMTASQWDEEVENYLRHVFEAGTGHGDGGFPGTFPTTHFEISWTTATLFQGGFSKADLDSVELRGLAQILINAFQNENGIIGFAPRAPDVDDTAKALVALRFLDQPISPEPMIRAFEKRNHFATFGSERDPSGTSNCHVLLSLLRQKDVNRYASYILKATEFVCDFWWQSDRQLKDKWHLSHLYPTMLLIEAFIELLHTLDTGLLADTLNHSLKARVTICLVQACQRTLLTQDSDGSWNQMPEQTCYAVMALAGASEFCLLRCILDQMRSAIEKGVQFLESHSFKSKDQNWTSKTRYNVSFVAEAYTLAALKIRQSPKPLGSAGHTLNLDTRQEAMEKFLKLICKTTLFSVLPDWQIRASLLESSLFVPLLGANRLKVYARDSMPVGEDKYLDIIPFTWIGCSNRKPTFLSTSVLYEMMLISMLGYQTDEFFESTAASTLANSSGQHEFVDGIFGELGEDAADNIPLSNPLANGNGALDVLPVRTPLKSFVAHVLNHKHVLAASSWDRGNLRCELKVFLHAHATQNQLNSCFELQKPEGPGPDTFCSNNLSFFQWVRTTGADHVACAYSFYFVCCLMSSHFCSGRQVFPTVSQKYLAAAAVRHLTTSCRMHNDIGSIARDTTEHNVNSMHFPEFSQGQTELKAAFGKKKVALTQLARYEDSCLDQTLGLLGKETVETGDHSHDYRFASRKLDIFQLYCDVTALYNQLYVLRDLSSSMK